ncbi:MAG: hypothetical protein Q4A78_04210 [Peptostreptococcaceae bacterium]|nr:hypothetical protein [Peptostreptococcaceae bacterium]
MLLIPEKSKCRIDQKEIVSKDKGSSRKHKAVNLLRYKVRHYQLDGDLIRGRTCCDFLLLNDTGSKAYLIELKGSNLDKAVEQLEEGRKILEAELSGYEFFYRAVCSRVKTHKINSRKVRSFKEKHPQFIYKTEYCEEKL